ncbi:hypothetical protein CB1_001179038 [Camelus ferus]|nr:hypothetical protein CB1_001179038 [Camelus ferus]
MRQTVQFCLLPDLFGPCFPLSPILVTVACGPRPSLLKSLIWKVWREAQAPPVNCPPRSSALAPPTRGSRLLLQSFLGSDVELRSYGSVFLRLTQWSLSQG